MTRETGAATATESLSASLGKTVGSTSHRRLQIVGFRSEMHVLEGFIPIPLNTGERIYYPPIQIFLWRTSRRRRLCG
jgi:hypothetical protein